MQKTESLQFQSLGAETGGALAVPYCLRRAKKQGCRRQPCSLSLLDRFYLTQSGFFGFLGSFFPKKLPKWGMGRSPIKIVPHVGVRGAVPRKIVLPAGRGAPKNRSPCGARSLAKTVTCAVVIRAGFRRTRRARRRRTSGVPAPPSLSPLLCGRLQGAEALPLS